MERKLPEVTIKKTGLYAFGGLRVVMLKAGDTMDLSQADFNEITKTAWAKSSDDKSVDDVAPDADADIDDAAPIPPAAEDGPDFEFASALADDGDKDGLAEYSAGFGVQLDKRKSAENMLEQFKGAV